MDGKNLFGITLQGDCGYTHNRPDVVGHRASEMPLPGVSLTRTHDFSDGLKSAYFEYKLGLPDLEKSRGTVSWWRTRCRCVWAQSSMGAGPLSGEG
ncbi:MAG: hypothetical protein IJ721_05225 [Bacteroidales bacterium]|nr:hypothetical protein [Bacteroidales bacterium]